MSSSSIITVTPISPPSSHPPPPPAHHVGTPPTSFRNPWPSFATHTRWGIFQTRFFSPERNFVPVPESRDELVGVRTPDWGSGKEKGLKATWIGHASWFVEMGGRGEEKTVTKGVRVLLDPVWSERTSPVGWIGPKRYTPVPCSLEEVPPVDLVIISHNHYDHLDTHTIREIYRMRKGSVHFFCALGNAAWFHSMGIQQSEVTELDWWHGVRVDVPNSGSINLTCTPAQHVSQRTPFDAGCGLWCSWVLEEVVVPGQENAGLQTDDASPALPAKKLFFAGDTGYRAVPQVDDLSKLDLSSLPHCPAFSAIGERFGPFDLALLPIGLFLPRHFMSSVHCAPEDSVCIHKDIKSKKSLGMHWGTVRGGISGQFEDVREPPRRWRREAEKAGLVWGKDVGLVDIGETYVVE